MKEKQRAFGSLLVGGSAVIYGISPALMKITFAYGGTGLLSTFYTCTFALPFLWLWARMKGHSLHLSRGRAGQMAILATSSAATSVLLYSSYSFIPVGMATTLHYIYPIAAAFYLVAFCGERLRWQNILSLILAAAGIVCISASSLRSGGSLPGILLALFSGFTWAFYMVYLERSGLAHLPPEVLNTYTAAANILFSAGMCVLLQGGIGAYTLPGIWLLAAFNGLLHKVGANAMFHVGIRNTSALSASIISTFEPVVSVLIGTVMLHEALAGIQILGLVLVLSGILCDLAAGRGRVTAD